MKVGHLLPVVFSAATLLSACLSEHAASIRDFETAPLFGMVYDERNEPCTNAQILVDGHSGPTTDINGRFVLIDLSRGSHEIEVAKPGFETVALTVDFLDRNQVLYVKVASLQDLLDRAEQALAARRFDQAGDLLDRADGVEPGDPVALYLRAVLQLQANRPEQAVAILEALLANEGASPPVLLTLADIYQYKLGDPDSAVRYLQQYLSMVEDAHVEQRLSRLQGD